ncbi:hypothetical protein Acr_00g0056450 [Actinidia rufa]|uniref:Uncharacterized protein n=1 Tax=Actinidia rufa TaxID=165716 RepID=A0A7J0DP70_9ERIC|nr:hypothetical protein Acr_00g0056450 [Actinidia rufa]
MTTDVTQYPSSPKEDPFDNKGDPSDNEGSPSVDTRPPLERETNIMTQGDAKEYPVREYTSNVKGDGDNAEEKPVGNVAHVASERVSPTFLEMTPPSYIKEDRHEKAHLNNEREGQAQEYNIGGEGHSHRKAHLGLILPIDHEAMEKLELDRAIMRSSIASCSREIREEAMTQHAHVGSFQDKMVRD